MNPATGFAILSWLFFTFQGHPVESMECYSCSNASAVCECTATTRCSGANDICFSEYTIDTNGKHFSLGCRNQKTCPLSHPGSGSIIGRSTQTTCSQCCDINNCNRQLCQVPDSSCTDTKDFSCATIGSTVNYCLDPHHSKTYCRHFCGLCSLRDGGWSAWSTWSSCDVTCANGTQARSRACTNPEPKDCGDKCVGSNTAVQVCSLPLCPVHGAWSAWSTWGACSATCDVGIERRDRHCSNPYPSRYGNHCFGDSRDDRLCFMTGCHDGGWSSWLTWSSCTRTCGDGLRSRSRNCDNPKPSLTGSYCVGDPHVVDICNIRNCHDGGWSSWSTWSACTRTCGDGLRSRSRNCDNPKPSLTGSYCVGDPLVVEMCNVRSCREKLSAFTVTHPTGSSLIKFTTIVTNIGDDYSSSTGRFTCEYPGLYFFAISLTKVRSSDNSINDLVSGYIYVNGNSKVQAVTDPQDDSDVGSYEATATLTIHLSKGDYVDVMGSAAKQMESNSLFSGFLIRPDP